MASRSDDFDRTGSVTLSGATPSDGGSAWAVLSGGFATGLDGGTGQVVAFITTGPSPLACLEASTADATVQAEIIDTTGVTQSGVAGRVVDASNYYYWFADGSGVCHLYKQVAGTFTLLGDGTAAFAPGVGKTIALTCQGTTITGYVDGVQDVQVTDASLAVGTKYGLRTNGTGGSPFYNSLTITDLSGGGGVTIRPWWIWATQQGGG